MPCYWDAKSGDGPSLLIAGPTMHEKTVTLVDRETRAVIAEIGRVVVRDATLPHSSWRWDLQLPGEEPEWVGATSAYVAAKELERAVMTARFAASKAA